MQIQTFAWAAPIPRHLYLDKPALYDIIMGEFEGRLSDEGGIRVPGPIRLRFLQFGYIDDDSMKEVLIKTELSPLWTYVVVHVSCPAVHP
jgi:hypothetical protein